MSLYMPFTSPPNSPTRGMSAPPRHWPTAQNGEDPRLPKRVQQHVPAIGGPPSDSMLLQLSSVLAMCQRVGRQVNLGQLRTIDMRVDLRGRYIGMSQDLL